MVSLDIQMINMWISNVVRLYCCTVIPSLTVDISEECFNDLYSFFESENYNWKKNKNCIVSVSIVTWSNLLGWCLDQQSLIWECLELKIFHRVGLNHTFLFINEYTYCASIQIQHIPFWQKTFTLKGLL